MNSDSTNLEIPVRSTEVISAVLAAFACEQIAQSVLVASFTVEMPWIKIAILFSVAVAMILTLVRQFHRNSVYLKLAYTRWSHREREPGSLIAPPIRHLFDVFSQLFQYVTVISACFFLAKSDLVSTFVALAVLFALDTAWLLSLVARTGEKTELRKTIHRWLIVDIFVLASVVAGVHWLTLTAVSVVVPVSMLLCFIFDYMFNYDYFFNSKVLHGTVKIENAVSHLEHFTGLYDTWPTDGKTWCANDLSQTLFHVFSYFMEQPAQRGKLFARSPAMLTVGLYVEDSAVLKPVFRCHDKKIKIANRTFSVGDHYLGSAYNALKDAPNKARLHHKPMPEHVLSDQKQQKKDEKHYRSSVIAGVFSPNGGRAVGLLIITSSEDEYFTSDLHEIWMISLAREVSLRLTGILGSTDEDKLRAALIETSKSPIVCLSEGV